MSVQLTQLAKTHKVYLTLSPSPSPSLSPFQPVWHVIFTWTHTFQLREWVKSLDICICKYTSTRDRKWITINWATLTASQMANCEYVWWCLLLAMQIKKFSPPTLQRADGGRENTSSQVKVSPSLSLYRRTSSRSFAQLDAEKLFSSKHIVPLSIAKPSCKLK